MCPQFLRCVEPLLLWQRAVSNHRPPTHTVNTLGKSQPLPALDEREMVPPDLVEPPLGASTITVRPLHNVLRVPVVHALLPRSGHGPATVLWIHVQTKELCVHPRHDAHVLLRIPGHWTFITLREQLLPRDTPEHGPTLYAKRTTVRSLQIVRGVVCSPLRFTMLFVFVEHEQTCPHHRRVVGVGQTSMFTPPLASAIGVISTHWPQLGKNVVTNAFGHGSGAGTTARPNTPR